MTLQVTSAIPADSVLDIACGTGQLLDELAQQGRRTSLIGIDRVPAMLSIAKQRLGDRATLLTGRADAMPFGDRKFDLITCTSALHYFPDAELALQEMRRVINPDGNLVITDWCRDFFWMKLLNGVFPWTAHAHEHTFGSAELRRSLAAAGFRTIDVTTKKIDWFWGMMTVRAEPI
jgi:ubiquinone/menaquinone biosynthesis C-methylase UbiE